MDAGLPPPTQKTASSSALLRRRPAGLRRREDFRGLLFLQAQQVERADLRLSVYCRSRLQRRPRAGFDFLSTSPTPNS